jgi:hypothetical protein
VPAGDDSNDWEPDDRAKTKGRKVKTRALRSAKAEQPMLELSDGNESEKLIEPSDEDVEPELKQKAQKKPKVKKEKKELARKRAGESDVLNPNLIKVKNKLVGNLEQGDLYASDDGNNKVEIFDEIIDEKLDLGNSCAAPKITQDTFLAKLKKNAGPSDELTKQIQQLGFKQNVSANELAARGIQISLRDNLIQQFKAKPADPVPAVANETE